jgi:hypothetical protein
MSNHKGGAITDLETLLPLLGIGYLVWNSMDKRQQGALLNQKVDPAKAAVVAGQVRGGRRKKTKSKGRVSKRAKRSKQKKSKSKRRTRRA